MSFWSPTGLIGGIVAGLVKKYRQPKNPNDPNATELPGAEQAGAMPASAAAAPKADQIPEAPISAERVPAPRKVGSVSTETMPMVEVQPKQAGASPDSVTPGVPSVKPMTLSTAAQNLLNDLQSRISAAPVTAQDIMNSPEYQAQKNVIDLNRGKAQAALNRSMASRNMLRSTPSVQALAASDAEYTGQEDALVPQLMAQATNQRQTAINNALTALNSQLGVEGQMFSQGVTKFNSEAPYNLKTSAQQTQEDQWQKSFDYGKETDNFNRGITVAGLTGRYLTPAQQSLIDRILKAKQANPDGKNAEAAADATTARSELAATGIDADKYFGAGVTYTDAVKNAGQVGWTQAGRTNEANLSGVDPVTGEKTPQRKIQDLQVQGQALANENAQLQAQIDANPDYGLAAQARQKIEQNNQQIALIGAQIQAEQALATQRLTAEPKPSQADTDSATAKKTRVEYNVKEYRVSPKASTLWEDYVDILGEGKSGGAPYTDAEAQSIWNQMVRQTAGLVGNDSAWLDAMHRGASDAELQPFRRSQPKATGSTVDDLLNNG